MKRLVCLLLTMTLLLSSAAFAEVSGFHSEGLPIVDEPYEITIAIRKEPLCFNAMNEKPCVVNAEKETNVKINWIEIPATNWVEKINLYFASGSLPDAIMGGVDPNVVVQNLPSIMPLDDLIKQYAPSLQKLLDESESVRMSMTAPDGHIYSLLTDPVINPKGMTGGVWFINKKWLDKLGLAVPTTTDELYEALVKFKTLDPDGDGKQNEIPLAFCQNEWSGVINTLFGPFGVAYQNQDNYVNITDHKVNFTPSASGFRGAIEWLHKLYAEELLNQEGFTQTSEQYFAKGASGVYGVFSGFAPSYVVKDYAKDYVALPVLKGPDGTQLYSYSMNSQGGKTAGILISATCKCPEVILRWYEHANRDLESKIGWNFSERGLLWEFTDDTKQQYRLIYDNVPEGSTWDEVRYAVSAGPAGPQFFDEEDSMRKLEEGEFKLRLDTVMECSKFFPAEYYPKMFEDPAMIEERQGLFVEIDTYVKNFVATCIINGLDDGKWEKHLQTCAQLESDKYVQSFQTAYDQVTAK